MNSLKQLYRKHRGKLSDKWSLYLDVYERIFAPYRQKPIRLLEIGVLNGGSLEIWSRYFQRAKRIVGCDIDPKCSHLRFGDDRIRVIIGNANSDDCEKKILQQAKIFDIIIDDGSHASGDVICSFARYFPHLSDGGIYVVEDLHASYWEDFGGGLQNPSSAIAFFKRLVDVLNFEHWRNSNTRSRKDLLKWFEVKFGVEFDEFELAKIHSIEFINSLCIIRKLPYEDNLLGKRVIVGREEHVTSNLKRLNGTTIQEVASKFKDDSDFEVFKLIDRLESAKAELALIKDSFGYALMRFYARILHGLLPDGTRRGEFRKILVASVRIARKKGVRSLCRQAWEKIKRREFYIVEPESLYRIEPLESRLEWREGAEIPDFHSSDYWILSKKISEARKRKLEKIRPKPLKMISLNEGQLLTYAKSLSFPVVGNPQISIIIPVYNNDKLTIECLASILTNTKGVPYEVIVVDDGSSLRMREILSQVKGITYLKNPNNIGYLLSCNRAAEKARGEYLLFLNNDVQVTEGWLRVLADTFSQYENVGAVGPKVLFPDGRLQEAGARIRMDASSQLIGLFDDPESPRYNYVREVEYCSGSCLLLPAKIFRELDGFDDRFAPGYYEDADLCFRIRARGLRILYNPNSVVIHHLSATVGDSTYKRWLNIRNQQKFAEKWQEQIDAFNRVRLIAFYLPQYHPIPENDLWWGKGFTEWTNVTRARPNFLGHYQPHLPADLGFYDLRVQEVMEQQAELAKRYGIYGFCYFYYWFAGKRLLEMPLERMLETGKPDIPFCLCWANENWTRRWDGRDDLILIGQRHSDEDDRAVIRDVMRYMRQPNYIRINGKPLFLVYRVSLFPDIKRTTEIWRELCRKEGIGEIYLAMVESFEHAIKGFHPSEYGFDASVEYPPHQMSAPIKPPGELLNPNYRGVVNDYREIILRYLEKDMPGYTRFRTVMPGWDNTPRRQNDSVIFIHSSPGAYQAWLEAILELTLEQNFGDERIVFINAWNEWAEGNHLEPDQRFGHGFLEATKNALERTLRRDYNKEGIHAATFI